MSRLARPRPLNVGPLSAHGETKLLDQRPYASGPIGCRRDGRDVLDAEATSPGKRVGDGAGAFGFGYLGWRLCRDSNLWLALIAAAVGAFIGAWVGLLLYWLVRLILAIND